MFVKISLGQSLVKQGITQGCNPKFCNESFEPKNWFNEEQMYNLEYLAKQKYPTPILGFEVIRGSFHGRFARIKPMLEDGNWGLDYTDQWHTLLNNLADALTVEDRKWVHTIVDGSDAVIYGKYNQEFLKNTWTRWKKNNHSSHLLEATKKNWEVYHTYLGDLDKVGAFDPALFDPSKWREQQFKNI